MPPSRPAGKAGSSTTSASSGCGVTRASRSPTGSARSLTAAVGTAVGAMCPIRPNALWALDFQFDVTADGRTLKLLNIVDEYTRECPAIVVDRHIDADRVVATLDRLAVERGSAPGFVRFDNGPEFIAAAVADWCRFNHVDSVFIDPGSPWQNAWIESFNGRLRDEFLTAGPSTPCSKPKSSSRTGASTTTPTDPTAPTATSPPASSPKPGPANTNQHSHNSWTTQRGPITPAWPSSSRPSRGVSPCSCQGVRRRFLGLCVGRG